jgi:hypothetical protein
MDKKLLYRRIRKDTDSCACLSCGDVFTLNAVVYHVSGCSPLSPFNQKESETIAPSDGSFCLLCTETFPTPAQLAHHVVVQHPDTVLKCVSEDCEKTFKNTAAQKKHFMRVHMDEGLLYRKLPEGGCECISCEVIFTTSAIARHVADCSRFSPFVLSAGEEEKEIVLNQADEDRNQEDFEDIPDDICQELIAMYS